MEEKSFWSLKVPPPIQVIIAILIMYGVALLLPVGNILPGLSSLAAILVLTGIALNIYSAVVFKRANTQVSPINPSKTTSLVQAWPYSISRNPIYLAMVVLLIGAAVWFGNVLNFLTVIGFIWFITEFQIKPEEKALREIFGDEYSDYMVRVRRWI